MTEPLRPMSTGQLLDYTFALYRKNFWLFVGIATVGPAANVIFQLLTVGANVATPFGPRRPVTGVGLSIGNSVTMILTMVLGYIIMLAGMALSHAATVKAVAAVHLGLQTSITGAYKALRGRVWSVLGTFALIVLLMAVVVLAFIVAVVPLTMLFTFLARGLARAGPLAAIATALFAIVLVLIVFSGFIAVYVRYALAIQACVVENLRPRASMKRSVYLTKGGRWRVFAVYLVFLGLSVLLAWGVVALAAGAGTMLHNRIVAAILVYVATFIVGSITGPLATIGLSVLYYDERVRKEAFDLQLMLASLDVPAAPMAIPAQVQI